MSNPSTIPVIDIFAGPGGLGEGFSSFETQRRLPFKIGLSIEKNKFAHETLRLRSFFRQFPKGKAPGLYYDALQQKFPFEQFEDQLKDQSQSLWDSWNEAGQEAMKAELGSSKKLHREISNRISKVIGKNRDWVLIGGPPCQAYSLAGRVRNKGIKNYRIEDDQRSTLYREYLRIIAEHRPAVFVMENVKGMLSATLEKQKIFQQILDDLRVPPNASPKLRYRVLPVVATDEIDSYKEHDPRQFIVACEKYGVPQQRHRVILVGIREDLGDVELPPLVAKAAPTVNSVIHLLPRLRSGLSRTRKGDKYVRLVDDADSWLKSIQDQIGLKDSMNSPRWLVNLDDEIRERIVGSISGNKQPPQSRGSSFIRKSKTLNESHPLYDHFIDERLPGVCNHETRSHLDRDLVRYLFAAAYSKHHGISPRLHQFPSALLPNHKNATSGNFNDRFRVQLGDQPSTTITSHISKDGHYFIHPDPTQCRSLTVREAARLQTLRIVI